MKKNFFSRPCFLWLLVAVFSLAVFPQLCRAMWVQQTNPDPYLDQLRTAWGSSATDIYAAGDYGIVLHYDGSQWSVMGDFPGYRNVYGVWGSSATDVFFVADKGEIYRYDGSNWETMSSGTSNKLRDVWGTSATDVFATGDMGTLLHFDGTSWTTMSVPANTPTLQDVWGTAWNNVYAAGGTSKSDPPTSHEAIIIHYDGSSWSTQWTGAEDKKLKALWGASAADIYATGDNGTILHTSDGTSWSAVLHGLTYDGEIRDVWGKTASEIFAVGDYTTIFHYDGSQWSNVSADIEPGIPTNLKLHGLWGDSTTDFKVTVGENGTILVYDEPPDIWGPVRIVATQLGWFWISQDSGSPSEVRADIWSTAVVFFDDFAACSEWPTGTWEYREYGSTEWIESTNITLAGWADALVANLDPGMAGEGPYEYRQSVIDCAGNKVYSETYYISPVGYTPVP